MILYTAYIVDDDALIVEDIVSTVPWMDNGFVVVGSATSPKKALEEIPALSPDVVFSDLKMPVIDGVDMIQKLNERGACCEYVMISAYGTFENSRRFFRENGFDYILKPINLQEVEFVLERLAKKLADKLPPAEAAEIDTPSGNQTFIDLLRYLECNFNQKNTLENLGKAFNLTPNYICRLFAKYRKTTLTSYITDLRMKAALEAMRSSKRAYKEIAINCGYNDYFYFCRVFKEYYGASPSIYLRQLTDEPATDQ